VLASMKRVSVNSYERHTPNLSYLNQKKKSYVCGVDEAGRGPLAGPVVAACAMIEFAPQATKKDYEQFEKTCRDLGVGDSKKLSAVKRKKILEQCQVLFSPQKSDYSPSNRSSKIFLLPFFKNLNVSVMAQRISSRSIDEINILNASLQAMELSTCKTLRKLAIHGTEERHHLNILVDGNKELPLTIFRKDKNLGHLDITQEALVKGDQRSSLISLASIVAKEYRDHLMGRWSEVYPEYQFEKHSGYPTKLHRELIEKYGPSSLHRKSFKGVKEFLCVEG
jgi:ribonuclease HII